jgi:hypothetical protein
MQVPDYLHYTQEEVKEVLKITERKPARVGVMAQAERRQQEKAAAEAAAAAAAATAAADAAAAASADAAAAAFAAAAAAAAAAVPVPSAGKPPLPQPPGYRVKPSQSMVSLQGAGTSYVSGAGEEEGEEVVGGVLDDDLAEEVVDDRNIDEEFERQLEQQEDQPGSQPRANGSRDGTPGKQRTQRGSTPQSAAGGDPAAAAAMARPARQQSPFAAEDVQQTGQPGQQLAPVKAEGGHRVTFADMPMQQDAAALAAAPQGDGEDWEDVKMPAAAAAQHSDAWQQQQQQYVWQQQQQAWQHQQQDWQQWQQQPVAANGAHYHQQQLQQPQQYDSTHGQKRSWGQAAQGGWQGMDGDGYGAPGGPAASGGGGPTTSQQPSASTGGTMKKLRLSLKKPPAS